MFMRIFGLHWGAEACYGFGECKALYEEGGGGVRRFRALELLYSTYREAFSFFLSDFYYYYYHYYYYSLLLLLLFTTIHYLSHLSSSFFFTILLGRTGGHLCSVFARAIRVVQYLLGRPKGWPGERDTGGVFFFFFFRRLGLVGYVDFCSYL